MGQNKIREYKNYVISQLMCKYGMDEVSANRLVRDSYLAIALKRDAEETMHEPIEYWVDLIYNEETERDLKEM